METQTPYELKVTDKRPDFDKPESLPAQVSPNTIVMMAMQKGYTPELIEKMIALSERNDANEARKGYYQAVADFKMNPPKILKDKENSQFSKADKKSMYVSLGNLVQTVNPFLGQHGLSASWQINQAEKLVRVSCKQSHRLGHSETVTMEAPPDVSGGNAKNPIQQLKSTITYLRAVTFEAVTGLAATDDANTDDDGNGAVSTGPSLFEQWEIRCREVCEAAQTLEDIIKWWPDNSAQIKKELKQADAAKINNMINIKRRELKAAERVPGSDDA